MDTDGPNDPQKAREKFLKEQGGLEQLRKSAAAVDEGTAISISMRMLIKIGLAAIAVLSFLYAADKRISHLEDSVNKALNENQQLTADLKSSREALQRLEVYVVRIETSLQYQLQRHTEPKEPQP